MELSALDTTSVNQIDSSYGLRNKSVQSGYQYKQKCKLPDCRIPPEMDT